MIIYDLNLVWFTLDPGEADAVLIVDADTVLTPSFAPESLQLIAGRYPQLVQCVYRIKLIELASCHAPQMLWADASCVGRVLAIEHVFGPRALERTYHDNMIARNPC